MTDCVVAAGLYSTHSLPAYIGLLPASDY